MEILFNNVIKNSENYIWANYKWEANKKINGYTDEQKYQGNSL